MKCFSQAPSASGPEVIPLMTVMVMAEDARGCPVTDLQSSDFHIFDNDHEAKIVSLHVTNSRRPHNTIIFLDRLNMGFNARGRNTSALLAFLRKQDAEQMFHLYLYILNRDTTLVPVRSLVESAAVQTSALISLFKHDVGQVQRVPSLLQFNLARRYDVTALALENLVPPLIGAPGVKDIVWITSGVSIVNFRDEAPKLAVTLNQVNAPVYVALDRQHEWTPEESSSNTDSFETWELLKRLTTLTGGRIAFDVDRVLRKAQSDLRTAYQLIYAPAPDSWDNTNHTIRLECTRPGTNLRYKQIYFAATRSCTHPESPSNHPPSRAPRIKVGILASCPQFFLERMSRLRPAPPQVVSLAGLAARAGSPSRPASFSVALRATLLALM